MRHDKQQFRFQNTTPFYYGFDDKIEQHITLKRCQKTASSPLPLLPNSEKQHTLKLEKIWKLIWVLIILNLNWVYQTLRPLKSGSSFHSSVSHYTLKYMIPKKDTQSLSQNCILPIAQKECFWMMFPLRTPLTKKMYKVQIIKTKIALI